ncbi:MULE domain-containing protein [Trichonephila inaurata madagascariensis]|uniref:MULE domain-containing protein n=1 Tax=Trichonephila inaurata madagascariensis TaxID=2747483 RepID=A0A8X6YW61_9ARAC|nr:MULE domain-containing protein [Trichonephila inaurata madagascariensis]
MSGMSELKFRYPIFTDSADGIGSAKIGISCPAVIKVRQSTENVVVQYFPKHQNHETQLEHLRLSESDRTAIAGRLKEGVSEKFFCRILEKKLLLTVAKKKLCLLKKRLAIILKGTSILMVMLKGMKLMQFSERNDDKICTDGTYELNGYDFNLYSVLVVDEHKNGIPVAFCFSKRSSEDVFKIYFSAIKNTVGKIETTTFMINDAPAFYNAWSYVMGTVKNVLLTNCLVLGMSQETGTKI